MDDIMAKIIDMPSYLQRTPINFEEIREKLSAALIYSHYDDDFIDDFLESFIHSDSENLDWDTVVSWSVATNEAHDVMLVVQTVAEDGSALSSATFTFCNGHMHNVILTYRNGRLSARAIVYDSNHDETQSYNLAFIPEKNQ